MLFIPSVLCSTPIAYNVSFLKSQYSFEGRSFSSFVWNTGVFNQNLNSQSNMPGFQWPENSGKYVGLSAGMCIGAYYNGELRIANATYNGEFSPGYVINGGGTPIAKTSDAFHLYKVSKGDNCANNNDYCYWYTMIERGAPYNDVNNNGIYDNGIDIPGVKNAYQTIFVCLTDGFAENHNIAEGFSGGTAQLYSEVQFYTWSYDYPGYEDIHFMRYMIINKSLVEWKKTFFSMFVNPQIGDSLDDYVGCDTLRRLGYAYNRDNQDGTGAGNSYGSAPPAVGMTLLNHNGGLGMTSFHYVIPLQFEPSPPCEEFPYSPMEAYNLMRGLKKDSTSWLDAAANPPKKTKYTFSGDPETGSGWTEYNGVIGNCNGGTTGQVTPNYAKARTFIMSTGSENYNLPCPSFVQFHYAQIVARGIDNKNSVTKLKQLSDKAQQLYNNNFIIGINPISTSVPEKFTLHQNYPNPFNPETKIKFDVPKSDFILLQVFDLSGKHVETLVNENLNAGTYEVNFSPKNLSSGIYFYKFYSSSYSETKRMILVK